MKNAILAVVETTETGLHPVSLEVIAFAEILAGFTGYPVTACVIGDAVDGILDQLETRTGGDILGISIPGLTGYDSESYIAALFDLLAAQDFSYICIPHSARGADFAPVLAAKLGATCVSGVEKSENGEGGITFTRRVLNGKRVARVIAEKMPAVVTVQPGIFKWENRTPSTGKRRIKKFSYVSEKIEPLGLKPARSDAGSLQTADIVVAAGNGIGNAENLDMIKQLADRFPRSAVAGSRPVCDRQWLPYGCQVGVTGAVVRPRLYIACGISGASQHIAGLRESGCIVAINRDPHAAFFNFADLCIVEDLTTFIPLLLERMNDSG